MSMPKRLSKSIPQYVHTPKSKSQAAALQILQREDLNSKRIKIQSLLSHQMIAKYGAKNSNAMLNNIIHEEISSYLNNLTNLSDADKEISKLEKNIQMALEKIKISTNKQLNNMIISKMSSKTHISEIEAPQGSSSSSKVILPPIESSGSGKSNANAIYKTENESHLLIAHSKKLYNPDDEMKKIKEIEWKRKYQYKEALDTQMKVLERSKELYKQEKEDFHVKSLQEEQQYQVEIEEVRKKKLEESKRDRENKLEEIGYMRALKERERSNRTNIEKEEIEQARKLLELEEDIKRKKKEQEKIRQNAIIIENERNKAIREEMKREEHEYEVRMSKQYEEKLKREEEKRVEALRSKREIAKLAEIRHETLAAVEMRKKAMEEEQRINAAVEQRDKTEAMKEEKAREQRRKEIEMSKEINQRLIEARRKAKEEEKNAALAARLEMEREYETLVLKEKEAKEAKRLEMVKIKEDYDKQINERTKSKTRRQCD